MPATSAAPPTLPRRHRWHALGTECEIVFACEDHGLAAAFVAEAVAWVADFEARYSRFRPDSIVSRINAAAGDWVEIDQETERLIGFCASLHLFTRGALDATAGPLLRVWDYHRAPARLPADSEVEAARRLVGWAKVQLEPGRIRLPEPGMALDFGGWGKEYAVDAVAALALARGLEHVLVDFGHDLMALGRPPGKPAWHVGLEDPFAPGASCRGSLAVSGLGVAASGDYLRGFTLGGRRYGHIVDPRTGRPVANGCRQAVVAAPSCLLAGALSTALLILGPEEGLRLAAELPGVEARVVTDRAVHQSRGFFRHVVS